MPGKASDTVPGSTLTYRSIGRDAREQSQNRTQDSRGYSVAGKRVIAVRLHHRYRGLRPVVQTGGVCIGRCAHLDIGGPPMDDRSARRLRVLMLSWEYPPQVIGGLGRHVEGLSAALAAAGHHVTILTRAAPGAPAVETVGDVRILRPLPPASTDG